VFGGGFCVAAVACPDAETAMTPPVAPANMTAVTVSAHVRGFTVL
jgi:hypothetical protein